MDFIGDDVELVRRIQAWAYNPNTDDELSQKLLNLQGVRADILPQAGELLYAYRDVLGPEGLELLGQIFYYAEQMNWTTFNQGDRSSRIRDGARRDLNEPGDWSAIEDPEPKTDLRGGFDWRNPNPVVEEPVAEEPAQE